jgi:alanyl-tRNA synthetase
MRSLNRKWKKQKQRSRQDAKTDAGDWVVLRNDAETDFIGYDHIESEVEITRYRKVISKGEELFHLVFNVSPFYAESGGQAGDTGRLIDDAGEIRIINTVKENELNIHIAEKLPENPGGRFKAVVDHDKRILTANNHTATHLLHEALRNILGSHVEQKGSLVRYDYLRFDFSHFQKLSEDEIMVLEKDVNKKIREDHARNEQRKIPLEEARALGAISLFGEKYGSEVRTIRFGSSIELCGGIHVERTGQIGLFRIISESAIAAGIRRIEAVTGPYAEEWVNDQISQLKQIKSLLKNTSDPLRSVEQLLADRSSLEKQLEKLNMDKVRIQKSALSGKIQKRGRIGILAEIIDADTPAALKDIAFQLKGEFPALVQVLGAEIAGKAHIAIMVPPELTDAKGLRANEIIRGISVQIQGGGGGQPFFATAGGKNPGGLKSAIDNAVEIVSKAIL